MTHSKRLATLIDRVQQRNEAALAELLYCIYDEAFFDIFPGKQWPPRFGDLSADEIAEVISDARRLSLLPPHQYEPVTVSVPDHIVRKVRASA